MSFDLALRATEILLGWALLLQSIEHLSAPRGDRRLFAARFVLSLALVVGFYAPLICLALLATSIAALHRFDGPYNGGSDRMGVLILICLTLAHLAPVEQAAHLAFGYLALQLVLSYAVSGWVKIVNPEWRSGRALCDVFLFSAYPVSEAFRGWARRPRLLFLASWAVILLELAFPLALLTQPALIVALVAAAAFHLGNAIFFGLNRFFWVWLAAYPSLLWLQERIVGPQVG